MKRLNISEAAALRSLARSIGVSEKILYKMIQFESSWNPAAKNPKSSARGLFQWIDATAQRFGYSSSLALVNANPTIESQLKFAEKYFRSMAPFGSDYEFVMSNFLPAYRKYSPATLITSLPSGARIAKANPTIRVLGDYYSMVMKVNTPDGIGGNGYILPVLAGVTAISLFFSPILGALIERI